MYFEEWPKTPRLFRDVIVTEKIDGTNAAVVIEEFPYGFYGEVVQELNETNEWAQQNIPALPAIEFVNTELARVLKVVPGPGKMDNGGRPAVEYWVGAQSRSRLLTTSEDNHGFAKWVQQNARTLAQDLGEGRHFGEWWGQGIRRNYGLDHKRFSLFNTRRFGGVAFQTPNVYTTPVLYEGQFHEWAVTNALAELSAYGSRAVPGWDRPEGVCVYHRAADQVFKVTLGDDGHKG